jgi:hypothetical protein
MHPVVLLLLAGVLIFGVALLALVRYQQRQKESSCPHCHHSGMVQWFGRYRCLSCGGIFWCSFSGSSGTTLPRDVFWYLFIFGLGACWLVYDAITAETNLYNSLFLLVFCLASCDPLAVKKFSPKT